MKTDPLGNIFYCHCGFFHKRTGLVEQWDLREWPIPYDANIITFEGFGARR